MVICPRFHLLEINDQWWYVYTWLHTHPTTPPNDRLKARAADSFSRWPQFLREYVQDSLTLTWRLRAPIVQKQSPAKLVATTLSNVLGDQVSDYAYVDFASGAGGPTPYIERSLNRQITARNDDASPAKFVLTDLKPHIEAWKACTKRSENITYVDEGVDASNAPKDLLKGVSGVEGKKTMRLFSLAFHHFDDELATQILDNTADTADGFCIFELQSRTISSFITVFLLGPFSLLNSILFFWRSPMQLFFTYIIPLIPAVLCFDGYVSSLRTRTPGEVQELMRTTGKFGDWDFKSGEACHTIPVGYMNWIICTKKQ